MQKKILEQQAQQLSTTASSERKQVRKLPPGRWKTDGGFAFETTDSSVRVLTSSSLCLDIDEGSYRLVNGKKFEVLSDNVRSDELKIARDTRSADKVNGSSKTKKCVVCDALGKPTEHDITKNCPNFHHARNKLQLTVKQMSDLMGKTTVEKLRRQLADAQASQESAELAQECAALTDPESIEDLTYTVMLRADEESTTKRPAVERLLDTRLAPFYKDPKVYSELESDSLLKHDVEQIAAVANDLVAVSKERYNLHP